MRLLNPFLFLGLAVGAAAIIYVALLWIDLSVKLASVLT